MDPHTVGFDPQIFVPPLSTIEKTSGWAVIGRKALSQGGQKCPLFCYAEIQQDGP